MLLRRFFSLQSALARPPSCGEDMTKVVHALAQSLSQPSERHSLLALRATRLIWSFDMVVPMLQHPENGSLVGPLIVQNSKGVKQLRAFTTLDELRSKISSACVPTRLTPLEVCKLMNALCSSSKACILGIDGMQFDWERVGGKIQSVSVAASFVQQFLACTSSVEEDRVLRSVLKTPTLNFTLGQKQEDFVDTVDGLPMLFLVEDMAMEVCKDSDLATIPASFMNVSDEAADGCAIVFDVQNGQVNRYVAVDAERVRRLTHKEMQ